MKNFASMIIFAMPIIWVIVLSLLEFIYYKAGEMKAKDGVEKISLFSFIKINICTLIPFTLIFFFFGWLFLPVAPIFILYCIVWFYDLGEKEMIMRYVDEKDVFYVPFTCKIFSLLIMLGIFLASIVILIN